MNMGTIEYMVEGAQGKGEWRSLALEREVTHVCEALEQDIYLYVSHIEGSMTTLFIRDRHGHFPGRADGGILASLSPGDTWEGYLEPGWICFAQSEDDSDGIPW